VCDKRSNWGCHWGQHVDEDEPEEQDEVLVIAVAQTVVDIDAVVIKFFYATIADHAVEGTGRLYDLAVETEILEVDVPVMAHLEQIYDVVVALNVAWVRAVAN